MLTVTVVCGAIGLVDTGIGFGPVGNPIDNIVEYWPSSNAGARTLIAIANLTTVFQDVLRRIAYLPATGYFSFARDFSYYRGRFPAGMIPGSSFNIVGQAWSLGPEVLFYLAAPFFCPIRQPCDRNFAGLCCSTDRRRRRYVCSLPAGVFDRYSAGPR